MSASRVSALVLALSVCLSAGQRAAGEEAELCAYEEAGSYEGSLVQHAYCQCDQRLNPVRNEQQ